MTEGPRGRLLETFDRYADADDYRFRYAQTLVRLGQASRYPDRGAPLRPLLGRVPPRDAPPGCRREGP